MEKEMISREDAIKFIDFIANFLLREAGAEARLVEIVKKELMRWVEEGERRDEAKYLDPRYNIPNKEGLKREIKRLYKALIEEARKKGTEKIDKFEPLARRFGIIFFDVEGLKAVNDNFGHTIGDRFLELVFGKLNPKTKEISKFLGDHGLECFFSSAGGDEFVFIIYFRGWKNTNQSVDWYEDKEGNECNLLERFLRLLQQRVEEIDLLSALGLTFRDIAAKLNRNDVPKNFKWVASISGGAITFSPSDFGSYLKEPLLIEEDQAFENIMGAILNSASEVMHVNKTAYKAAMELSGRLEDEIILDLMARNEEVRRLLQKNKSLQAGFKNWAIILIVLFVFSQFLQLYPRLPGIWRDIVKLWGFVLNLF
ncbi:MAG: diguanylate cyclase [Patescibacteria group bacterium]|nr:diguanylate cyclase [Patescibacteria group bacterium]